MTDENEFRTSDLALASYLRMAGLEAAEFRLGPDGSMVWVFAKDEAAPAVRKYVDGSATVHPREFALRLASTRRDMYNFLDN